MPLSPGRRPSLTHWAVWGLPSRLIAAVLLVECTAVALMLADVVARPVTTPSFPVIALLVGMAVAHTEITLGVERMRRRVAGTPHIDLSSVWTFAAALLLPPVWASAVVLVIYLHLWFRVSRPTRVPVHRVVFTTSTVILAVHAAEATMNYSRLEVGQFGTPQGLFVVVLALLAYTTVNTCLVIGAIVMSAPDTRLPQVIGNGDEVVLEIATLSLGGLVAAVMTSANIWYVVLAFPALLVLHRAVLVRQLEEAASTDSKTGLLNSAGWHTQASRVLRRAQRDRQGTAVLMLDLDHFKSVNDDHGHVAGDQVLGEVAAALRDEVRDGDLVGRFGGEEFVILLPGIDPTAKGDSEVHAIAERIRRRISGLCVVVPTPDGPLTVQDLTVSVGGATHPRDGASLEQVLSAADAALYTAKRAGRNAVRFGPAPPVSQPATQPIGRPEPDHR